METLLARGRGPERGYEGQDRGASHVLLAVCAFSFLGGDGLGGSGIPSAKVINVGRGGRVKKREEKRR